MSDLVNADPNDVKALARELERYQQQISEINKRAQQAINRARWNDKQKQQFEQSFRNFQQQTDRFVGSNVRDFVKKLNALAHDLERAKSHRF